MSGIYPRANFTYKKSTKMIKVPKGQEMNFYKNI